MGERSKYIEAVKEIFESNRINYREEIRGDMVLVKNYGLWIVISGEEGRRVRNLIDLLRRNFLPYLILYNSLKEETYICDLGDEYKTERFKNEEYIFPLLNYEWWILTNLRIIKELCFKKMRFLIILPDSFCPSEWRKHNLVVKILKISGRETDRFFYPNRFKLADSGNYYVKFELEIILRGFEYKNGIIKMIPLNDEELTTEFIFGLEDIFKCLKEFVEKNKGVMDFGKVINAAFQANQLKRELMTKNELLDFLERVFKMDWRGLLKFLEIEKNQEKRIERIVEEIKNGLFINMYMYGGG
ncbi:MAG: hypothetical protein ABIM77_05385 [candidate division WOR-3 bacterium]